MPRHPELVCLWGETGSHRRTVRTALLTPNGHQFSKAENQRAGCLDDSGSRTQAFQINDHLVGEMVGGVGEAGLVTP
jgi:hypothetical protein